MRDELDKSINGLKVLYQRDSIVRYTLKSLGRYISEDWAELRWAEPSSDGKIEEENVCFFFKGESRGRYRRNPSTTPKEAWTTQENYRRESRNRRRKTPRRTDWGNPAEESRKTINKTRRVTSTSNSSSSRSINGSSSASFCERRRKRWNEAKKGKQAQEPAAFKGSRMIYKHIYIRLVYNLYTTPGNYSGFPGVFVLFKLWFLFLLFNFWAWQKKTTYSYTCMYLACIIVGVFKGR